MNTILTWILGWVSLLVSVFAYAVIYGCLGLFIVGVIYAGYTLYKRGGKKK